MGIPKFKERRGPSLELGRMERLRPQSAINSLLKEMRTSLVSAEGFGRFLFDKKFQQAIRDHPTTLRVDRISKKKILRKIQRAGLTTFPWHFEKKREAGKQ